MKLPITLLGLIAAASLSHAATPLTVDLGKPGAKVQPTMYGLFFEDINYAADGGLYAEMVKNRSFEFPNHLAAWTSFGNVEVKNDGPFERCPHYVTLSPSGHGHKHTGLENEGFFGVSFKKGETYVCSFWARTASSGEAKIEVQLVDPATQGENQNMAGRSVAVKGNEWKKYTLELKPGQTVDQGRLRVFLDNRARQAVDIEHISLFPKNTFRGDENGLRADLAQALTDLKPGVFRFPGGCIVEGTDLATRYQWKNTVGPVENRPTNENRWHYTFKHRFYPDYYQSNGLGFYEYFRLSEQMGAEPLPVINVGMACQYQNGVHAHVPVDSLQPYIQDAIDLIEFANGDTLSTWGKLRAEMGHPAPFNLKFLAVGNEQWGPEYVEHLAPFVKALRAAHPEIKIIGSSGPEKDGQKFDYLWPEMTKLGADLVDEHYYAPDEWFINNAARYDSYSRKGPKVFAGEYACHTNGDKTNHFSASLHEAAFMTGLERNADIVHMATYAPLLAHEKGWQWRPDLIWFNNFSMTPSSSYSVQQLFSHNKGTRVIPALSGDKPLTGQDGLYASAVLDEPSGNYYVKIVNITDSDLPVDLALKSLPKGKAPKKISTTVLTENPASRAIEAKRTEATIDPASLTVSRKTGTHTVNVPKQSIMMVTYSYK